MRNISFSLTTQQVRERRKTVTRRLGWHHVRPGDLLKPVEQCMGLKRGQRIVAICAPIRVIGRRLEPLRDLLLPHNADECAREGFPALTPAQFIEFFCASHRHCTADTVVTRIEFEYTT